MAKKNSDGKWALEPMLGMSVRTLLAVQALPQCMRGTPESAAEQAVRHADAVLVALGEAEPPPGPDPRIPAGRSLALAIRLDDARAQQEAGLRVSLPVARWRDLVAQANALDAMGGEEAPAAPFVPLSVRELARLVLDESPDVERMTPKGPVMVGGTTWDRLCSLAESVDRYAKGQG